MKNSRKGKIVIENNSLHKQAFDQFEPNEEEFSFHFRDTFDINHSNQEQSHQYSFENDSPHTLYPLSTPYGEPTFLSPATSWDQSSPLLMSPWTSHVSVPDDSYSYTGLMGSLVREEGSIYSLATSGDLLYTGSDSKNIRIWKNQKEFSSFKSNSGLVKAIIIAGEKIFTGHQDGKIRVWKVSAKNPNTHKRIGTLPTKKAYIKSSMNPSNYVVTKKHGKIKHFDAISSLSLSEDKALIYSASWDKTIKVWRTSNFKCLESINAHEDAVNAVIVAFHGLVVSGSADGSVKVWRRELQGKGTKHFFSQTLLKQECAVTALAIDPSASILYCGSSDGLVNFWEQKGSLSHGGVLRGHKLAVLCLATEKNLVFSGSADSNICVWRRDYGNNHVCLSVLNGHGGPVKCLAVEQHQEFGNDQQLIVYSGSLDKSVKIWRVSLQFSVAAQQEEQQIRGCESLEAFSSNNCFSSQGRRNNQERIY